MNIKPFIVFIFVLVLSSFAHADYTNVLTWMSSNADDYVVWHNFTNMSYQTKGTNNMNSSACYNTTDGNLNTFYNASCSIYHGFFSNVNVSSGIFSTGIIMNHTANDSSFLRVYGLENGGFFVNDSNLICLLSSHITDEFIYYSNVTRMINFTPPLRLRNASNLFYNIDYNISSRSCNYNVMNVSTGEVLHTGKGGSYNSINTSISSLAVAILRSGFGYEYWTGDELRAWVNYSAFKRVYTITFYDTVLKSIIQPAMVSFTVTNSVNTSNYTTITGIKNATLISGSINIIRSESSGYAESFYYVYPVGDVLNPGLSIYLTNITGNSEVTVTVIDEAGDPLEDSYVEILRYNPVTNTYDIVEVRKTNFAGQFKFYATLNDEFYKFIVEYPFGNVMKITSPSYVFSTSLTLQINTEIPTGENIFIANDVSYSLTYNNDTTNFRYTFSNNNNAITDTCLRLYKVVNTDDVLWNTTCSSSTSGTILQDVYNTSGTTWKAKVYIYPNNNEYYITEEVASFNDDNISSSMSLILLFVITLTVSFIAIWDKIVGIILVPIPAIIFSAVGLWQVAIYYPIGIEAIAFIIAIMLSSKTK